MALKLKLIGELCVVLAAYLLSRCRLVLGSHPFRNAGDRIGLFAVALMIGIMVGASTGYWISSYDQDEHEPARFMADIEIDRDHNGYELALDRVDLSVPGHPDQSDFAWSVVGESQAAAVIPHRHEFSATDQTAKGYGLQSRRNWVPDVVEETVETPAWRRYAASSTVPEGMSMVAIVIDDLGVHVRNAARTIALPGPLTLSFMSYARNLRAQTETARAAGHELILHLPMEPQNRADDPGPNVLLTQLSVEENLRRLRWALSRFDGFIGVNNHMGSRFTQDAEGMALVMNELRARGLMFLDSRTVRGSVSGVQARRYGVPFIGRDVFLDNVPVAADVSRRLEELEAMARTHGRAVGLAHPHRGTLEALEAWLPTLATRGIALVPISAFLIHPPE